METSTERWADRLIVLVIILFSIFMCTAIAVLLIGCTVTYEPETKACMIHFDPSSDQIKAIGEVCLGVVQKIRDEPAKIEFDPGAP